MAVTVDELINNNPKPVTVAMDTPVVKALQLMLEHDFSQLPIVSQENEQLGIVSAEGILKSIRNFGSNMEALLVEHAAESAVIASPSDDIFEVFERFDKHAVVLIADNENKLLGIITPWDTAAYLQRRAEDIMLIEDIEGRLKDHIRAAFTDEQNGYLQDNLLNEAIHHITDKSESNFKTIETCLKQYLGRNGIQHKPSRESIEESFEKAILVSTKKIEFADLNFGQYVDLLLTGGQWLNYGRRFKLDVNNVRKLLDQVREIRNKLAHFRGEITNEEREQLRFCRDWLERVPVPDFTTIQATTPITSNELLEISPIDEELSPTESRYAKLAVFLQEVPRNEPRIILTFERIEQILGGQLPPSAWEHRSWWANDSVSHVQSQQWLDAGWRVASVNMTSHQVTFYRNREREEHYINFFSTLLNHLRDKNFPLKNVSPTGTSWITVLALPTDRPGQAAFYNFSFARGDRFRVELYIDTQNQDLNHQIFDTLFAQKSEIENELGVTVSWEKLETKRASRIAIYHQGSITDDVEQLEQLLYWACETMLDFATSFTERTNKAIKAILE